MENYGSPVFNVKVQNLSTDYARVPVERHSTGRFRRVNSLKSALICLHRAQALV